jgi:HAE1 family hydrophobic/amphiphilic exporter-1
MSSLAKKSIDNPVLVVIVFAILGIVGLFSLRNIPISLYPNMDEPVLLVVANYGSAGPESVEKSVTKILEQSLSGINNLKKMKSTSSEGTCTIELNFLYGSDLNKTSTDVRDKISEVMADLPAGVKMPAVYKFSSDSMPIMTIAIRGNRSSDDLKKIADDLVVDRMKQASGVSQVTVSGGRKKVVRVEISQNRLEAYGLSMSTVAASLAAQNLELGGGRITEGAKDYSVRTLGEYQSVAAIGESIVARKDGYVVRLSDIGKVSMGYKDASSAVYINGLPGVYVSITKQSGTNTVNVANAVTAKLAEIKTVVPGDVRFEVISDSSAQVRSTINALVRSAIEGAVLAMLILLLFFRNARSTLIMGVSIPFSILITLMSMKFANISLNMMTMTGLILGVGMIVDASVVILENIYQYRERGTRPTVAATLGTTEMFAVVLSGGLTHICVFLPVIFFQSELGFIGQMLPGIIFTIIISLVSSLFVALFLVPVLSSHFLVIRTRKERPVNNAVLRALDLRIARGIDALTNGYRKLLTVVLNHRGKAIFAAVAMLLLSIAAVPLLNVELMPSSAENSVTLKAKLPIGTKLAATDSLMTQLEKIARSEVKGYTSILTSAGGNDDFGGGNRYSGSLTINIPSGGGHADSARTIKDKLRKHFKDFPSVEFSFAKDEMGTITGSDIDITIRSNDIKKGLETSQRIMEIMKEKVPEVSDISADMTSGLPQIGVEIDRDRAYALGVDVADIAREINACLDGTTATIYHDGGNDYDVFLILQKSDRAKALDIEKIFVTGASGPVALSNIARAEKTLGPVTINRENQMRVIHVTASKLTATSPNVIEKRIKDAIASSMVVSEGVSIGFEGSWQTVQKTGKTFILIILMALILVYGVMAGIYGSFKDPLINMCTIPFGIIGILAIYLLTGKSISMFTAFGLVMLVGIAVNNGIILVDQTNLLVSRGSKVREACLNAAASRLRPILMTTLTTLLGMVPMAFFSSDNSEMLQPIGLAVLGGLTSSTLVTLFLIPAVFSLMHETKGSKTPQNKSVNSVNEPTQAAKFQGDVTCAE